MYQSCSTCVVGHLETGAAMLRIREVGFRYIDLFAFTGTKHLCPTRLASGDTSQSEILEAALAAHSLKISSFNCGLSVPVNLPDATVKAQFEREFLALLRLAERWDCPVLTVQTGGAASESDFTDSWRRSAEGLGHLRELMGNSPVKLTFEPHFGGVAERLEDALALAERLWPEVGVTYDPSHFEMQIRGMDLRDTAVLFQFTLHVHVRNAIIGEMQVSMTEGTVDFSWLVPALFKQGYRGAVAIEYLNSAEGEAQICRERLALLGILDEPQGTSAPIRYNLV